ncbi:MAG: carbohydrate-binding family 9-like protein [Polyangiaceae bacterium]
MRCFAACSIAAIGLSASWSVGCKAPAPDASASASAAATEVLPQFDEDMIPSVDVPRLEADVEGTIKIDGVLDEAAWERAVRTGSFVDVGSGKQRRDARLRGEARLFYTDKGLYIGFDVRDGNVRGGWDPSAIDPHLWERDTVEIMTKPTDDGTNKDYYEIQINPQNLVFDSHFDDYNQPNGGPAGPFGHQDYRATLRSQVSVHGTIDNDSDKDEGYTVEVFIDFASFGPLKTAPTWRGRTLRMNLYAMKDNGGVAWSPILGMGNFHKAARFGRVHLQ